MEHHCAEFRVERGLITAKARHVVREGTRLCEIIQGGLANQLRTVGVVEDDIAIPKSALFPIHFVCCDKLEVVKNDLPRLADVHWSKVSDSTFIARMLPTREARLHVLHKTGVQA